MMQRSSFSPYFPAPRGTSQGGEVAPSVIYVLVGLALAPLLRPFYESVLYHTFAVPTAEARALLSLGTPGIVLFVAWFVGFPLYVWVASRRGWIR